MSVRNPSRAGSFCKYANRIHFVSNPLFLLSLVLPTSSFAQLASSTAGDPDDSTTSVIATTLPSSVSLVASTLLTITTPTETSASSSSSFPTNTRSRAPIGTAAPTGSEAPDIDPSDERKSSVLNYYFVFLAIFAVIIFGAAYYLHRRKKLRKAQFRNSSQNALARDLDGWVISRRWIHGHWRSGVGGNAQRQEEGLNELGEAPPPYKATPESGAQSEERPWTEPGSSSGSTLTVPLEAHSPGGRATLRPPNYAETIRRASVVASDDQAISRPATAARHEPRPVSRPTTVSLSTSESTPGSTPDSTPDSTNELLSRNRSENS